MSLKIRLARGGAKKRPYYRIVVADSRFSRDGRFIEKLGAYNPMLPKDSEQRVVMVKDRVEYWLSQGATPSERVLNFLKDSGVGQDFKHVKKLNDRSAKIISLKAAEIEAKRKAEAEEKAKQEAEEAAQKAEAEAEAAASEENAAENAESDTPKEEEAA